MSGEDIPETEDQLMWGAALTMLRNHGDEAPVKIAERIGALALKGDDLGVAMWRGIAAKLNQLLREPRSIN